jgi:hypothetical protein
MDTDRSIPVRQDRGSDEIGGSIGRDDEDRAGRKRRLAEQSRTEQSRPAAICSRRVEIEAYW